MFTKQTQRLNSFSLSCGICFYSKAISRNFKDRKLFSRNLSSKDGWWIAEVRSKYQYLKNRGAVNIAEDCIIFILCSLFTIELIISLNLLSWIEFLIIILQQHSCLINLITKIKETFVIKQIK